MAEFFDIAKLAVDIRQNLTMTETYAEIGNVAILNAELGTYEYGYSGVHSYDGVNKSEYVRFSLDGGATWREVIEQPTDTSNVHANSFQFYKEAISGDLSLVLQARKEDATGVMTIHEVNSWIRRVQ